MITVKDNVNSMQFYAAYVEVGTAFLGTVNSTNGGEYSGLFIRTATTLFFVEMPDVQFDNFDCNDGEYSPEIKNFREVNVEVTVTSFVD